MPAVDVVVVGAGQAGLSLSFCLTEAGIEHVVLERGRVAESWRSARWDSFCLVTPNWATRLAGLPYAGPDPDGFMGRDDLVGHLEAYARGFGAPVLERTEVTRVTPRDGGFSVGVAGGGAYRARAVVVATATHRHPRIPALAGAIDGGVAQGHASAYRSPDALPAGAVLVVGTGQSGCQIAEELLEAGRRVFLATSRVGRLPRRYRGRDAIDWQRRLGFLDRTAQALDSPADRFRADPYLSGKNGGHTIDLRALARRGVVLLGRIRSARGRTVELGDELPAHLAWGDAYARRFIADVDRLVRTSGIDVPPPDEASRELGGGGVRSDPSALARLDLRAEGIGAVVWATGFRHDFTWVDAPVLDGYGYPRQRGGVTEVPGLHFLGLNFVDRRASGILYGVGEDAAALARLVAARLEARGSGRLLP